MSYQQALPKSVSVYLKKKKNLHIFLGKCLFITSKNKSIIKKIKIINK